MNHVEQHLPDFLHGKLNEADSVMVENHLRMCSRCRLVCDDLRMVYPSSPPVTPVRDHRYFNTILPRVRDGIDEPRRRRAINSDVATKLVLPLAVSLLFLVVLTSIPERSHFADPIRPLVEEFTESEMLDVITDLSANPTQIGSDDLQTFATQAVSGDFIPAEVITNAFAEGVVSVDPLSMLDDMPESTLESVIRKLEERTVF